MNKPELPVGEVLAALDHHRGPDGKIPTAVMQEACEQLERSPVTVRRWLRSGPPPDDKPVAHLTRAQKVALFEHQVSRAAAYRALVDEGQWQGSRALFYRAVDNDMGAAGLAYLRDGRAGLERTKLRLERIERDRAYARITDHKQVPVQIALPGKGEQLIKPWLTCFEDPFSRVITAVVVSVRPTRAEVLAGLAECLGHDDRLGPGYGIPEIIRHDNGTEFLTKALASASISLGFSCVPIRSRSPWLNGKIERFWQTITRELFSTLPRYTAGPPRPDGTPDIPAGVVPLTLGHLVERIREYVATYNYERPHAALQGRTPAQAWAEDATEVREADEQALRRYTLEVPRGRRTVEQRGVFVEGAYYQHADLHALIGDRVEPRWMPHDERWIDVWSNDRFVCRATRQNLVNSQQRAAVRQARRTLNRDLAALKASATRRAKARWAGMTEPGPAEQIDAITTDDPDLDPAKARLRLLGLEDRRGRRRPTTTGPPQ